MMSEKVSFVLHPYFSFIYKTHLSCYLTITGASGVGLSRRGHATHQIAPIKFPIGEMLKWVSLFISGILSSLSDKNSPLPCCVGHSSKWHGCFRRRGSNNHHITSKVSRQKSRCQKGEFLINRYYFFHCSVI
jgi:hypothetical protein